MSEQPELSQRLRVMVVGGFSRALELAARTGARGRFMSPILCVLFGFAALAAQPDEASALSQHGAFWLLVAGSFLAGGLRASVVAVRAARKRRPDVNLLMIIAALGSLPIGHWNEGAVLLFLFSLSDALEFYAFERTQRSVTDLIKLRPDSACVVRDGREFTVPVDELRIDDRIRVRPGERFAIDGRVVEGSSAVDESVVTGEPLPVDKKTGDDIFAGTINTDGSLLVRMTRPAAESTIAKIVHMVKEAQDRKAPVQRLIEKWEPPFVIGVLGLSVLTMLATFLNTAGSAGAVANSIYAGMVLLVAASPCAVVLSSPVAVLATVTRGAGLGILFKGGSHIERLASIDRIAFDKTGTLTEGRPILTEIHPADGISEEHILARAAAVERHSEHPIAAAIVRAAEQRNLTIPEVENFVREPGLGIHATLEGRWIGVGSEKLFSNHGVTLFKSLREDGDSRKAQVRVIAAEKGGRGAVFVLEDRIRDTAPACISRLRECGIEHIMLLTGDRAEPARQIANELGIDEVRAELMPDQKMRDIVQLAKDGRGVAMIGDGVNDAPALAAATVGIAMGAAGTDVALETADIVLMRDDLSALPAALELARDCRRVIQQSLAFAFGVIALLVLCTLTLGMPLSLAVLCHEGSTVLVVLNGLRMLRFQKESHLAI